MMSNTMMSDRREVRSLGPLPLSPPGRQESCPTAEWLSSMVGQLVGSDNGSVQSADFGSSSSASLGGEPFVPQRTMERITSGPIQKQKLLAPKKKRVRTRSNPNKVKNILRQKSGKQRAVSAAPAPQFLAMKRIFCPGVSGPGSPVSPLSPHSMSSDESKKKKLVPVQVPLSAFPQVAAMKRRLIGLEHFRRMASMKIPELQKSVQMADYTIQKRNEQIACLNELLAMYESQQIASSEISSSQLQLGRASVFQAQQPERRHSFEETRPRSLSGPSTQETQPSVDLSPILDAQKRRIEILKSELINQRETNEKQDKRFKKAVAYKGKVKDEFKNLHTELHSERQALVKARREVRRLVGKRSDERMQYEKLQAEMDAMRAEFQALKAKRSG